MTERVLTDEERWRIALAKDRRFDGRFLTGVHSTGIYCRPSCPARAPKRENVRFYASIAEAEAAVRSIADDLPMFQHEFDALVDLVYNVGPGALSIAKSPRLMEAIAAHDYEAIAGELEYHHAGGQLARGLVHRSERRTRIFMNAAYGDPREAAGAVLAGL